MNFQEVGDIRRINVVGCAGSGKSTVAKRIAEKLDLPHTELDALHWRPNWTPVPDDEFREQVHSRTAADAWVIDGNYWGKLGTVVWGSADAVVWLDLPRYRIMWQLIRRTAVRAARREELWHGNREGWGGFLVWRKEESILWWSWTSYPRNRSRYEKAMADPRFADVCFHRLRSRRDIDAFVASL